MELLKKSVIFLMLAFLALSTAYAQEEPASVVATATKLSPFVGEEFTVITSIINTGEVPITGILIAKGSSGLNMYDIEARGGASNQWTSGQNIIQPRGGKEEIRFNAVGNEEIATEIECVFKYDHKGEKKETKDLVNINVKLPECGNGFCELGEDSENCCMDCGCKKWHLCVPAPDGVSKRCFFDIILLGIILGACIVIAVIAAFIVIKKRKK